MSKQMTPCEKLGYKVGDKFTVIKDSLLEKGTIVVLSEDDGSEVPWFTCGSVRRALIIGSDPDVEPTPSKLKPAKQALADAIYQNGGWPKECHWVFSTSNGFGSAFCWTNKPKRSGWNWLGGGKFTLCCEIGSSLPNWHQTILSRDEYFTAYPEQVKIEVDDETEHKVDVEMKSESEMTINVSDWHKNGELPPVGEVCIFDPNGRTEFFDEKAIGAIGKEVSIISHVKFKGAVGSVAVFMCDSDGVAIVRTASETCFRPLRTEREKAIGEMVDVITDGRDSPLYVIKIATKLYDAGYRKEVK